MFTYALARRLFGALASPDLALRCLSSHSLKLTTVPLKRHCAGAGPARWALLCHVGSWFVSFCAVRPFSSSLEAAIGAAALVFWPWRLSDDGGELLLDLLSCSFTPQRAGPGISAPTLPRAKVDEVSPTSAWNHAGTAAPAQQPAAPPRRALALCLAAAQFAVRPTSAVAWVAPVRAPHRSLSPRHPWPAFTFPSSSP